MNHLLLSIYYVFSENCTRERIRSEEAYFGAVNDRLRHKYEKKSMVPTGSQNSESKQQDCSNKSTCGLSRLPVELLDMVLKCLDLEEVFNLGIQTPYFWKVSCRHIQAHVAFGLGGSWAGEGVICAGGSSEPKDLPLNVLTEVEREGSQKLIRKSEYSDDESEDEDFDPDTTNLYDLAHDWYPEVDRPKNLRDYRRFLLLGKLRDWPHLPSSFKAQISIELESYDLPNFYPDDQPWILRNLTTQEYVRSEAIAVKPEHIRGPHISGRGFGEVVMSRTCWSTDGACAMKNTHDIHRGIWAGHHFDIRTLESHRQGSLGLTEWKDVSEEVANEMDRLWTEEFGSDWRDHIHHDFRFS